MRRWWYVRGMMRAIERARRDVWSDLVVSRTDGLTAIKDFESRNGVKFDPYNRTHIQLVRGMGKYAGLFRSYRRMRARYGD